MRLYQNVDVFALVAAGNILFLRAPLSPKGALIQRAKKDRKGCNGPKGNAQIKVKSKKGKEYKYDCISQDSRFTIHGFTTHASRLTIPKIYPSPQTSAENDPALHSVKQEVSNRNTVKLIKICFNL